MVGFRTSRYDPSCQTWAIPLAAPWSKYLLCTLYIWCALRTSLTSSLVSFISCSYLFNSSAESLACRALPQWISRSDSSTSQSSCSFASSSLRSLSSKGLSLFFPYLFLCPYVNLVSTSRALVHPDYPFLLAFPNPTYSPTSWPHSPFSTWLFLPWWFLSTFLSLAPTTNGINLIPSERNTCLDLRSTLSCGSNTPPGCFPTDGWD